MGTPVCLFGSKSLGFPFRPERFTRNILLVAAGGMFGGL